MRTKYGIVLSVVIALVLVAFILGDQLSYRGGDEGQNQVAVKINGKAITEQQYAEYGGNMAAVVCDNFYAPELENVGLTFADEHSLRTEVAANIMQSNPTMPKDEVNMRVASIDINQLNAMSAMESVNAALTTGYYNNKLDIAAYEREAKGSVSGRYIEFPYATAPAVEISDEEVKARYDELSLVNGEYGARTFIYVEFPHAQAAEGEVAEEVETPEQREARIQSFITSVGTTPEAFVEATNAVGYSYLTNTAKVAQYNNMLYFYMNMGYSAIDAKSAVCRSIAANDPVLFGSEEFAMWVYDNAVVGDVKKIESGDRTYVVMVESIDENEKLPYEDCESAIRTMLANDKKYEALVAAMPASIERAVDANVVEFKDVTFGTEGYDSHLLAALFASKAGDVVKVQGKEAAYLVVVDAINEPAYEVKDVANSHYDEKKSKYTGRATNAYNSSLDVEFVNESYNPNRR